MVIKLYGRRSGGAGGTRIAIVRQNRPMPCLEATVTLFRGYKTQYLAKFVRAVVQSEPVTERRIGIRSGKRRGGGGLLLPSEKTLNKFILDNAVKLALGVLKLGQGKQLQLFRNANYTRNDANEVIRQAFEGRTLFGGYLNTAN